MAGAPPQPPARSPSNTYICMCVAKSLFLLGLELTFFTALTCSAMRAAFFALALLRVYPREKLSELVQLYTRFSR